MKNVIVITVMMSMLVGCTNVVTNGFPLRDLIGDDSGGSAPSAPETESPKLYTGNPSDEFTSATFDESRWNVTALNSSLSFVATANGVEIGGDGQAQTGIQAFALKANYIAAVNNIYGDSVVGELHVKLISTVLGNQTGVTMYFANGKRVVSYVYVGNVVADIMARVDIYDTDGTTLLFHSTPIKIGNFNVCQEYKIAPNINGSSTAQWNVDFSDNCASLGHATYTALDHATLGATDYIGSQNSNVRFEVFGNREPIAVDSDADPFFGFAGATPVTLAFYQNNPGLLTYAYRVELLNWNFSVFGAKIIEK